MALKLNHAQLLIHGKLCTKKFRDELNEKAALKEEKTQMNVRPGNYESFAHIFPS